MRLSLSSGSLKQVSGSGTQRSVASLFGIRGTMDTACIITSITSLVLLSLSFAVLRPSGPHERSTHLYARANSPDVDSLELLQVQVIFRHGARTPLNTIYTFPNETWQNCLDEYPGLKFKLYDENGSPTEPPVLDPDNPKLPGGCPMGLLTENGFDMAKALGDWLRRRYVDELHFLPSDFHEADVKLRTTPIRRTIATLRGVMAGLWPDAAQAQVAPVPVAASFTDREIMYGSSASCPALGLMQEEFEARVLDAEARDPHNAELAEKVASELGINITTPVPSLNWTKLYDVLAAMTAEHLQLPPGATEDILKIVLHKASVHEAAIISPGPDVCPMRSDRQGRAKCDEALRLSMGPLVARLLGNMQDLLHQKYEASTTGGGRQQHQYVQQRRTALQAEEGPQQGAQRPTRQPKLLLFSGHDSSVSPMLAVLHQRNPVWPPFTANIVFELWQERSTQGQQRRPEGQGEHSHSNTQYAAGEVSAGATRKHASRRIAAGIQGRHVGGRAGYHNGEDYLHRRASSMRLLLGSVSHGPAAPASSVVGVLGGGRALMGTVMDAQESLWVGRQWVRVLYNGNPLVIPHTSSSDGWLQLSDLKDSLAQYTLPEQERYAACKVEGLPPGASSGMGGTTGGSGAFSRGGGGGGSASPSGSSTALPPSSSQTAGVVSKPVVERKPKRRILLRAL